MFFCSAYEKTYNQKIKIEILVKISNKTNVENIIEELCEYVSDRNIYLSEHAVKGLG